MSKKNFSRLTFILWVTAFVFSFVQPAYAAPLGVGQEAPALLQFTSGGHMLGFTAGGMWTVSGSHALRVDFVNANPLQPRSVSPAAENARVAPLEQVTYTDLWNGITLDYSSNADYSAGGGIYTTTYHISPGANPADIRLHYSAPLALNPDGSLSIAFQTGTLSESAPIAWQQINLRRVPVAVAFQVDGQQVGFTLGAYDPAYPLIIDPTLTWNTFFGGSGLDDASGIALDGSGNIYVVGDSPVSWGTPLLAHNLEGYSDAFVAKLDSSGALLWNTFLGCDDNDVGYGIAVDSSGNVFVTGKSNDTWGIPLRAYLGGSGDAFLAKLNSSGTLLWNTFLGGIRYDRGNSVTVDGSGFIYVTGESDGTWGTPLRAYSSSGADAFIVKLNSSGTPLWNTFLGGGSGDDDGYGIAVDGSGNVLIAGKSNATWGSPVRAYHGGAYIWNAFVARLNSSGALTWNTFLGGSGDDEGFGIALDASGNIYTTGTSNGTWGSPLHAFAGGYSDAFVAKISSSGTLVWNTFIGSASSDAGGVDNGTTIAADGSGHIYVTGWSVSTWGTPQRAFSGSGYADAFVAKMDSSGTLKANTFLGGNYNDFGNAIDVDNNGNVVVTGYSDATWGSPRRAFSDNNDAFVVKVNLNVPPAAATLVSPLATTTTHTPTYIWSKVADATLYRLWIKNSVGAWVVQALYSGKNICGTTNCAVTPATSLPNGVYSWYIQTLTATLNGTWSGHSFTVAVPTPGKVTLVSPKGTIHISKPTFIWTRDSGSTLYRLWVKNAGGTWIIQKLLLGANICGSTNCAIVSPGTLVNGTYTWYIQTLTATQNGQWSGQSIVVSVPDVASSPSGGQDGVKK